ncbi:MAG: lipoyl(octanoyl) transferase LipB [Dehalococcoidia bacterium]
MSYRVHLLRWGRKAYRNAWEEQEAAASDVRAGGEDCLVLVEHPPVYTFGRRVRPEHLLVAAEELTKRGAEVVESDRGGDITFHGPGQIVGYPILDLKRRGIGPNEYVRGIEEVLIRALDRFGIVAERAAGRPGVWVGNRKIAAIGVRLRGGVTTHGFALNVCTDLSWFEAIVPCGLNGFGVTSIGEETVEHEVGGGFTSLPDVENALVTAFEGVFDSEMIVNSHTKPGEPRTPLKNAWNGPSREAVLAHGH